MVENQLHKLHLKDIKNPIYPSTFEDYGNYKILVLRLPELWEGKPNILALRKEEFWKIKSKFISYSFVFISNEIHYYNRKTELFEELTESFSELYVFLNKRINELMEDINTANDKIAFIEENIYKRQDKFNPLEQWNILKKDMSKTERILIRSVDVFNNFLNKTANLQIDYKNEYSDLNEHLERSLRYVISANNQLDEIYRYQNLQMTDRLNRSIYLLTIISVIFLPLTLVVGFFGMNTGGLPFQGINGTLEAFVSMIVFAIVLTVFVLWKIKKY